jgi:hypothetical protein
LKLFLLLALALGLRADAGNGLWRDPGEGRGYVAPNPVRGNYARLIYRMRGAGRCHVRVFQASGQAVGAAEARHDAAGLVSCEIPLKGYADGAYFCRADLIYDGDIEEHLPAAKFLILKRL